MSKAPFASTRANALYASSDLPTSAYARTKSFFAARCRSSCFGSFREACATR